MLAPNLPLPVSLRRIFALFGLCLIGAGCGPLRVSVNDNDLVNERQIFSAYQLADPALNRCVQTVIKDRTLTQASGLTQLNCAKMNVHSLEGLEVFANLRYLNLAHNQLTSVASLLLLGELEEVDLQGNPALLCAEVARLREQVARIKAPGCI